MHQIAIWSILPFWRTWGRVLVDYHAHIEPYRDSWWGVICRNGLLGLNSCSVKKCCPQGICAVQQIDPCSYSNAILICTLLWAIVDMSIRDIIPVSPLSFLCTVWVTGLNITKSIASVYFWLWAIDSQNLDLRFQMWHSAIIWQKDKVAMTGSVRDENKGCSNSLLSTIHKIFSLVIGFLFSRVKFMLNFFRTPPPPAAPSQ